MTAHPGQPFVSLSRCSWDALEHGCFPNFRSSSAFHVATGFVMLIQIECCLHVCFLVMFFQSATPSSFLELLDAARKTRAGRGLTLSPHQSVGDAVTLGMYSILC